MPAKVKTKTEKVAAPKIKVARVNINFAAEEAAKQVSLQKISKDIMDSAYSLGRDEARFLVDAYYIIQDDRKRSREQLRQIEAEPHALLEWFFDNNLLLEKEVKKALDRYSITQPIGARIREVKGIGPVIAAGLIAHIDIHKAPTVGHIWRFAGLDPTSKWEKGKKRPWNADLKVLCWKIGESFCKFSTGEDPSPYGILYRERKRMEIQNNEQGLYAEKATDILKEKNYGKDKESYLWYSGTWVTHERLNPDFAAAVAEKARELHTVSRMKMMKETGEELEKALHKMAVTEVKEMDRFKICRPMLPPKQIDQRAKRWAVKVFLSHMHQVWFEMEFKKPAPIPYAIAHLNHVDFIPPKF